MATKSNERSFNLEEAKELIKSTIEANRRNIKEGIHSRITLKLEGESGIGKTTMPEDLAEELGMDFVKINLGQIEELGDLIGYPGKKFILTKDGEKKAVDEKLLAPFIEAGWEPTDDPPVMFYAPPEWISGKGQSGILLLDDYSRADARVLQATMELIDKGQYISWALPPDWHVILTTNPDTEDYVVNTMDVAQEARLFSVDVVFDADVWVAWATANKIPSKCMDFILLNPEVVRTKYSKGRGATARAWSKFFHAIAHLVGEEGVGNLSLVETLGSASVGSDLTSQFISYFDNKQDLLPDMKHVVFSEEIDKWIKEFDRLINSDGQYRTEVASAISTKFARYVSYVLDRKLQGDMDVLYDNIERIITSNVLGIDMSFALTQTLMANNRVKLSKVFMRPAIKKFIVS